MNYQGQFSIPNNNEEGIVIAQEDPNTALHNGPNKIEWLLRIVDDLSNQSNMLWQLLLGLMIVVAAVIAVLHFGTAQKGKNTVRYLYKAYVHKKCVMCTHIYISYKKSVNNIHLYRLEQLSS